MTDGMTRLTKPASGTPAKVPAAALSGLKVIESGDFITAPYASKLLADLGAEVIKVERPHAGDISRQYGPFPGNIPHPEKSGLFLYLNTNKSGITLDIEKNTGREIFRKLIEKADVFIENTQPGYLKSYSLDYDSLKSINAGLIMASLTPFGQAGAYSRWRGYAINASALGGISLIVGEPGREPITPPLSYGNFQAGAMAVGVTMAALLSRHKDGKGKHLDISEADCWATFFAGQTVSAYIFNQRKRQRTGHRTPGAYPYTVLPCKDGFMDMIAVRGGQWKSFLEVLGDGKVPDWYENDERFKDRIKAGREYADILDSLLAPWLMAHTKEEIFAICREKRVPFAPVRDISEVVNDVHYQKREFFTGVGSGDRKIKCPGGPYKFFGTPWEIRKPAPLLGEHNDEIYRQMGYARQEITELRRTGII